MPYRTALDWAFSSDPKAPIPKPLYDDKGKETINILKYNSPITAQYLLQLFIMNGPLNHYLNSRFNNIGLFYLEKCELLLFIRKCIRDYKIQRNSVPFIKRKYDTKLHIILRKKCPTLKGDDVSLLCDIINGREDKDQIYHSLNLEKPEKTKMKKLSDRSDVKETNVKKFLEKNFSSLKY
jgi:hypothetical protein